MDVNAVRRNLEEPKQEGKENAAPEPAGKDEAAKVKIIMEPWTPHDMRRTAATNLSALGFSDEVVDAVLNHVKKGVMAIYNRHRYDREKQQALEAWERKLNKIIGGKGAGKVISITTAKGKAKAAG